jgi:hypothetical protein
LALLWPLAFLYSTFSGYASITTNRTVTSAVRENVLQRHQRIQADYDDATDVLRTGKQSPLWQSSAGCTASKSDKQRIFCANISAAAQRQKANSDALAEQTAMPVDPEVAVLTANTGWTPAALSLVIALAPALILELVSSLGFYAVHRRPPRDPRQKTSKWFLRNSSLRSTSAKENASRSPPDASGPKVVLSSSNSSNDVDWTMP